MAFRAFLLLLIAALTSPVYAQKVASEVTDAQIAKYKAAAQASCRASGKKQGDPDATVNAFCNCMIDTLDKSMTHSEWQQAAFHSSANRGEDEARVLQPHLEKLSACRPRP